MIIDGGWGTGKTEFCLKLINLIENSESNLKPLYIDAFKADHADEPLMTVLSSILKLLPEAERPTLMEAALPVAKFGLKTGLKAGVSWVLRQDASDIADDFASDLKSAGDQAVNYAVESLLTDHVEAEKRIDTLKKALAKVSENSPIVIFIDELDRCRPNFAVSMLESIKHIFDVENVQFVLVTNSNQLKASINHCYGDAVEAHRYLDKFIAFSFKLPESFKPDGYNDVSSSIHHMHQLIKDSELLAVGINTDGHLALIDQLIAANTLSLREVETFVLHLEIYQVLTEQKGFAENTLFGHLHLRLFGVFLFCFHPDIAHQLTRGVIDVKSIAATLGKVMLVDIEELKGDYPDSGEVISVIVGLEATQNQENFIPKNVEASQEWEKVIRAFFGRGLSADHGARVKIIVSSIEALQLGGR